MTTFLEQQQMKLVREALSLFPRGSYPRYQHVQANEHLLLDTCKNGPMSLDSVFATLNRIQHQLVVSPAYEESYREFFTKDQEHQDYAHEGNISIFNSALRDLGLEISVDALEDLFHPGSPNSIRDQLSLNSKAQQAQAEARERTQLIADISRGQSVYSCRDRYGKVQKYQTSDLDGESTERLREIAGIVSEQRRFLAMPAADQKNEINATLKQQWTAKTEKSPSPLPPQYEVPGKIGVTYPWSRALLVRIHVQAPEEYKRLKRLYGEEQINAIIVNNGVQQ